MSQSTSHPLLPGLPAVRADAARWQRRGEAVRRRLGASPAGEGSRWIETPGAVLRVRDVGHGAETVVLAPDPPNVLEHYTALIEGLRSRFRVVGFELPGFGFSFPRASFRFTVEELGETICALLDTLDVRRATLSMACLGAFGALLAAAQRPARVKHLLLSQLPSWEAARAWTREEDILALIKTPWVGQVLTSLGRSVMARQWYRSALPSGAPRHAYLEPTLGSMADGACFCLASAFQQIQRRPAPALPRLETPATVLWGRSDRTHRETDPRSVLEHLPRARLVEIGGCGHFPDLERPRLWTCLLDETAEQAPSAPGPVQRAGA